MQRFLLQSCRDKKESRQAAQTSCYKMVKFQGEKFRQRRFKTRLSFLPIFFASSWSLYKNGLMFAPHPMPYHEYFYAENPIYREVIWGKKLANFKLNKIHQNIIFKKKIHHSNPCKKMSYAGFNSTLQDKYCGRQSRVKTRLFFGKKWENQGSFVAIFGHKNGFFAKFFCFTVAFI